MLLCGQAWGQYTTVKQVGAQWLPLRIEWNGGGIAGLDSSDLTCLVRKPSATTLTAFALTSAKFRDEGQGNYSIAVVCSTQGPCIVSLSDSNVTDTVKSGDVLAPYSAFQTGTNLPGDATGMTLCFTSGLNTGECFYIATHDTSAGANTDTIVLAEGTETYWHRPWGASDTIKAGDDFRIFRFNYGFVYSITDSAGAGGGADTADIRIMLATATVQRADSVGTCESLLYGGSSPTDTAAIRTMMLTATIQRADTTGVAETLLAGGSTGSDTTNIKASLATAHGAGSWLTATGFAVAGDAMTLTVAERRAVRDTAWTRSARTLTNWGPDSARAIDGDSTALHLVASTVFRDSLHDWTARDTIFAVTDTVIAVTDTADIRAMLLTARLQRVDTAAYVSTYSPVVGGSNAVRVNALLASDSTALEDVIVSAWTLDYGTERTYGVTSTGGYTTLALPTDSVAIMVQALGYTSAFDTIIVVGADTAAYYLSGVSIPTAPTPSRCVVWGDILGLEDEDSAEVVIYPLPSASPQYSDSALISLKKVRVYSDTLGRWTVDILRGAQIRIEISGTGFRGQGTVPNSVSANFRTFIQ